MRAWQYSDATCGLENNLKLDDFPDIKPALLSKNEVLVKVLAAGLNPADYKVPEMGRVMRATIGMPAIPGSDYAGKIIATHPTNDSLKEGELVFGRLEQMARIGSLGEYTIANLRGAMSIPKGVGIDQAAALGTAALTSHQSLVPYVKSGQKVFINGGSGGTGTYAIQIAKILGAHVTTTCSTGNIDLMKELGADEVVDYKSTDLVEWLSKQGQVFDHVVDNIDIVELYHCADKYMKPDAKFIQVGLPAEGNNMLKIATSSYYRLSLVAARDRTNFLC
jgi:NADPH:quinone reductase-like Zn-dependent oxidoreductase